MNKIYEVIYGETSNEYKNVSGKTQYLAYICMGGSGFNTCVIANGEIWRDGCDEFFGFFPSQTAANNAIDDYMAKL